jgi:hypothetical protein
MRFQKYFTEEDKLLQRKIKNQKEREKISMLSPEESACRLKMLRLRQADRMKKINADPLKREMFLKRSRELKKAWNRKNRDVINQKALAANIKKGRKMTEEQKANWVNPNKIYKTVEERKRRTSYLVSKYRERNYEKVLMYQRNHSQEIRKELHETYLIGTICCKTELSTKEIREIPGLLEYQKISIIAKRLLKQKKNEQENVVQESN